MRTFTKTPARKIYKLACDLRVALEELKTEYGNLYYDKVLLLLGIEEEDVDDFASNVEEIEDAFERIH